MPRTLCSALLAILVATPALAQAPSGTPVPASSIDPTLSASFAGAWSMTAAGGPNTKWVTCSKPVRLVEADANYFFYLGTNDTEGDAATELIADSGGARWEPIAGGPSFFAVFTSPDSFYLYDEVPRTEADWLEPTYLYERCP